MDGPLVIITDPVFSTSAPERAVLSAINARMEVRNCHSEEEVIESCHNADALMVGWAVISGRVLDQLPHCRIISRYGIGVDMIDIEAATARGVVVCNVPDYCIEEVATHTLAMLLALARKLFPLHQSVKEGRWDTVGVARPVHRLSEQTLGLLSLGRIGRAVASRAQAFGLTVIAHDPYLPAASAAEAGVELVSFDELLQRSDFLSIHAPLMKETFHIIDAAALARMKPGAYLINNARGRLIDEAALAGALRSGHLAGAALDVRESEPPQENDPLAGLETVILTPHAAWYSEEAQPVLQRSTAEEIVRFFRGERPRSVLNPPAWERVQSATP